MFYKKCFDYTFLLIDTKMDDAHSVSTCVV